MDSILRGRPSPMPFIGAFFKPSDRGWKVEMLFTGSSAEESGLRKGDIVTKVNRVDFTPIGALSNLDGTCSFTVIRSGKELSLNIEVSKTDLTTQAYDSTRKSIRVFQQNGKRIGYIKLWLMLDSRFQQLLVETVTNAFQDTDAMILDLRDGFGGSVDGYPDVFFRPAVITERAGFASSDKRTYGYSKPLIALVNEGTRSAKESFSYMLNKSKRATLVGSRTAGKLLGATPIRISDWAILEVPRVNILLDGKRLEGVGIEPDILVKPEYSVDGEDMALKEALKILTH